ncbi:MGMT family protein [Candidatus Micrarchaeota archaeon]|nr:MGMT family protein [Candidatus Micrarchaeota archaeon]
MGWHSHAATRLGEGESTMMKARQTRFSQSVLALTKRIPRGRVSTYRDIARALHSRAYRAVGHALHHNPDAPRIPCHRVVRSGGGLGGYAQGARMKTQRLRQEGVRIDHGMVRDFSRLRFRYR